MTSNGTKMRWDPYIQSRGDDFIVFWKGHLSSKDRKVLFIIGKGFDQRALRAMTEIISIGSSPDVWVLAFDNGLVDSNSRIELTADNLKKLHSLVPEEAVQYLPIEIDTSEQRNVTAKNTIDAISKQGGLSDYDDVVIDISAMPRMVAMTSVAKILYDLDRVEELSGKNVNMHVTISESIEVDKVSGNGTLSESVTHVAGFSGELSNPTEDFHPRVWFPVLGEGQNDRLTLIREKIDPDEICPVLPFPSRAPRRGDEIIHEYRQTLFEDFQVEPRNILNASEYSPFEAYKQLFQAMDRYRISLNQLGGCKAFVSPLSSKLLSIGSLLACYDHKYGDIEGQKLSVGIPYVETAVYEDPTVDDELEVELYSLWLRGEWEK